jgi:hypothetical protein
MRAVGIAILACGFVSGCDQPPAPAAPATHEPTVAAAPATPPPPPVPPMGDTPVDQYVNCAGAMAANAGLTENDDPGGLPKDNMLEPHVAFMINALEKAGVENEQRIARIKASAGVWSKFTHQQQEARIVECRTKFNSH